MIILVLYKEISGKKLRSDLSEATENQWQIEVYNVDVPISSPSLLWRDRLAVKKPSLLPEDRIKLALHSFKA